MWNFEGEFNFNWNDFVNNDIITPDIIPDTIVDNNPKEWDDIRIKVEIKYKDIRICKFVQKPNKLFVLFWVEYSCMHTKSYLSYRLRRDDEFKKDSNGTDIEFINVIQALS